MPKEFRPKYKTIMPPKIKTNSKPIIPNITDKPNKSKSFPNKTLTKTNNKTDIGPQSNDLKGKARLELPKTGKSEEIRPFLTTEQSVDKLTAQTQNGINPNREFSNPGVTVAEQNLNDANELPYIKLERVLTEIDSKIRNLSDISKKDFENEYGEIIYAIFYVQSEFNYNARVNLFQDKSYGEIWDELINYKLYDSFLKLTPFEQRCHLKMGSESSCPDFSKIKDDTSRKAEISKYITDSKNSNGLQINSNNLRLIEIILEMLP
jgi:hypothetical protein